MAPKPRPVPRQRSQAPKSTKPPKDRAAAFQPPRPSMKPKDAA